MGRWSYQRVEGMLFGLEDRPEAHLSTCRPRDGGTRPMHGPLVFPEIMPRADVSNAVARLDPSDRSVIRQHYLHHASVPKGDRRRAVKKLVTLLTDLDGMV